MIFKEISQTESSNVKFTMWHIARQNSENRWRYSNEQIYIMKNIIRNIEYTYANDLDADFYVTYRKTFIALKLVNPRIRCLEWKEAIEQICERYGFVWKNILNDKKKVVGFIIEMNKANF